MSERWRALLRALRASPTPRSRFGFGLMIASPLCFVAAPGAAWLPLAAADRALAGGGLLVFSEAIFWVGLAIAGPEVARAWRARP